VERGSSEGRARLDPNLDPSLELRLELSPELRLELGLELVAPLELPSGVSRNQDGRAAGEPETRWSTTPVRDALTAGRSGLLMPAHA